MAWNSLLAIALGISTLIGMGPSSAQSYPDRPVILVVPSSPGGNPDIIARLITSRLETRFGWRIVYEYKPGANGSIGVSAAAKAAPDGYTLLTATSAVAINPSVYKAIRYNLAKDLVPVGVVAFSRGYVLVVNSKNPVTSVKELIEYSKTNHVLYGSAGIGNAPQLATELFNQMAGISIKHVPFRGSGPAVSALLANTVHVMISPLAAVEAHIESKALRALAVTGTEPMPGLPDVPLLNSTFPAYSVAGGWNAFFVPTGTPPEIVQTLNQRIREVVRSPETVAALKSVGYEPGFDKGVDALSQFVRSEAEWWAERVGSFNLEVQ